MSVRFPGIALAPAGEAVRPARNAARTVGGLSHPVGVAAPPVGVSARLWLIGAFGVTAVANYAVAIGLGWLLTPAELGSFAVAQALLLLGGLLLEAGIPLALARVLVGTDRAEGGPLVRSALVANLLAGAAIGGAVLALRSLGPLASILDGWAEALAVAGALVLIGGVTALRGAAQGCERFWTVAALQVIEVVVRALVGVGAVVAGLGVVGAVGAFVVGAGVAGAVGAWVLRGLLRGGRLSEVRLPGRGVVGGVLGAQLGLAVVLSLDLLALKLTIGEDGGGVVGHYQAAVLLANAPFFLVASGIVPVAFTALARCAALPETVGALRSPLGLVAALLVPCELVLAAFPDIPLGLLFPPTYGSAAAALQARALGMVALLLAGLLVAAHQAAGRGRRAALLLGVAALAEVAVIWLVGPGAGGERVAAAFAGVVVALTLALAAPLLRALDRLSWRQLGGWVGRLAVALGAGWAVVMLWAGGGPVGIAALAAGGISYGAAAVALRLVAVPPLRLPWPGVPAGGRLRPGVTPTPTDGVGAHRLPASRRAGEAAGGRKSGRWGRWRDALPIWS